MYDEMIEVQVRAARIACGRMSPLHLEALRESVEQARRVPAASGWERKAAAYAGIFDVLADAADDQVAGPVISNGAGLAYDLMVAAGRAADGMTASSRRRLLAHLCAGDAERAALELEKHLRVLHYMCRLARCGARRASA